MAIDSKAKRASVTNLSSHGSLGLINSSGIDSEERPNVSRIYGFISYTGALAVPLTNVEPLWPIQPTITNNTIAYQKDSREWEQVQKSDSLWRSEITSIRFRIFTSVSATTFYVFHNTNKNTNVELNLPGIQPFLRSDESNEVRILSYTALQQVMPTIYEMTVTYRNIIRVATT